MVYGQDEGQPHGEPWQPQPYDSAVYQRRMQGLPQGQSWQQSQPGYELPFRQEQPGHRPPGRRRRKSWPARHKVLTGIGVFIALSLIVYAANPKAAHSGARSESNAATTPAVSATATSRAASATATASAPRIASQPTFPPKTVVEFRAFAATGDAGKVHQLRSSTEGLPSCPEPNIDVAVSRALTGKALEADLAAFFVQHGLLDTRCQAFVFAFHGKSDYLAHRDYGYTAGRVALTNTGSGSQMNLEVDAGDVYNFPAEFDFNF